MSNKQIKDTVERICAACNKNIANEFKPCTVCKKPFHPGCSKKKLLNGQVNCCSATTLSQRATSQAKPASASEGDAEKFDKLFRILASHDESFKNQEAVQTAILEKLDALPQLIAQVQANTANIQQLQEENQKLNEQIANITSTQTRLLRENRRANVEAQTTELIFSGIPSSSTGDELTPTIIGVANALGVHVQAQDILSSRKLISKSIATSSAATAANRDPPIIIKFSNMHYCKQIIDAKRKHGRLTLSQMPSASSASGDASSNIVDNNSNTVMINEMLPNAMYRLLMATKDTAKKHNIKYVWHRNGIIFVRKEDGARVLQVNAMEDLLRIIEQDSKATKTT